MDQQPCPICHTSVAASPRYPRYVCGPCVDRAVDEQGRPVAAYNSDLLGHGVQLMLREGNEKIPGTTLMIDGVRCTAAEARFGGIVVQPSE